MGEFSDKVFDVVKQIPAGKVSTYGQIARLIGSPRSARYVGFALRSNPSPSADGGTIPCHRVIFKDGTLCEGFIFGGPSVQHDLLASENVVFLSDGRVDMNACQWDGVMTYDDKNCPYPTAPPPDFDWAAELGD